MKAMLAAALVTLFPAYATSAAVSSGKIEPAIPQRDYCENTPTSRNCWGDYSIDTDYYDVTPDTGVTREYWLSAVNITFAPDGYLRDGLTFNGSFPGPEISADWGDNLIIHVTNNLENNGTSIHWHGIRQLNSSQYDGVPGVTQCPIAPGDTMTYKFRATQYGTTWYHSHFSLQYGNGLLGPIVIRGPATANYDIDLGSLFLTDWGHEDVFTLWEAAGRFTGPPPVLANGLINGTNVFNCSATSDAACLGTGFIRFSIDNHTFQVIANDLVPIQPFKTDNLMISIGQRYDVVVEADQAIDNYWLRATWQTACSENDNADNILGIIRYTGAKIRGDPTTTIGNYSNSCTDLYYSDLIPHLPLNVGSASTEETLILGSNVDANNVLTWTINSSALVLDWADPTYQRIQNNDTVFPTPFNVVPIDVVDEWVYWVIEDKSGFSGRPHPMHLHGHDFFIVAQDVGDFNISSTPVNLVNPPRRDVASLPGAGYLVMAFKSDNPGSWLMHCHIAWHQSQGLAMQFVERESEISSRIFDPDLLKDTCKSWSSYKAVYGQDDSGI